MTLGASALASIGRDLRCAWRNLRARRSRPVLAALLLAIALAANALVFATADSLVFNRTPYPHAGRLIELRRQDPRTGRAGSSFLTPALLDEWRTEGYVLDGVEGHLSKTIFLSGAGEPAMVRTADVTVGLFDLLGVRATMGTCFR
jgi:hypothetical protein